MGKVIDLERFRKEKERSSSMEEKNRKPLKQPENLFECLPFSVRILLQAMYVTTRRSQDSGRVQISESQRRLAREEVSALSDEALYERLLQFDGADLQSPDFKRNFRWNIAYSEALYARALECPPRGEK